MFSVLINISSYWCQLFILLKSAIMKINSIYRAYLWQANPKNTFLGNVRWSDVCKKKKDRGLGLRNSKVWNKVVVSKLAWQIHHLFESLWVRRVHGVYTKGVDLCIFNPLLLQVDPLGKYVILKTIWHIGYNNNPIISKRLIIVVVLIVLQFRGPSLFGIDHLSLGLGSSFRWLWGTNWKTRINSGKWIS